MGGAVFDLVLTVRFMDETGAVFEREKAFLEPHYRSCDFLKSRIALSAVLTGNVARTDEIAARMKEFSLKRWEHQPKEPSAGCTFKNPATCPAGKLIDQLGMGGGTGTGASPVLARIAKESGALVLSIVTLPFEFEGGRRQRQAQLGLQLLKSEADAVICLPNERLQKLIGEKTSVLDAFKTSNALLAQGIRGIWRLLTCVGLINVDFADLCSVTRGKHGPGKHHPDSFQSSRRSSIDF